MGPRHRASSRRLFFLVVTLWVLIAAISRHPALAVDPAPKPTPAERIAAARQRARDDYNRLLAELTSGDPARVTAAVNEVHTRGLRAPRNRDRELNVLYDAKQYEQANAFALELMLIDPADTNILATLQKFRVRSLIALNKPAEALSAAKAYYFTSRLADTADAISTVSLCLATLHPEDPGIARRFKMQQLAGAATQPAAEPAADQGPSILASIEIDPKPFEAAIASIILDDYKKYVAKGNLLLAAGRAKEAREIFEKGFELAPGSAAAYAIEDVARGIRADTCSVGAANAYIMSKREGGGL